MHEMAERRRNTIVKMQHKIEMLHNTGGPGVINNIN